jgi:hypothetical protein
MLLLVLVMTGCAAQTPPAVAPHPSTKRVLVTVVVRSAATEALLHQAAVTIDGATQITSETGVVVFALVARQTCLVTVVCAGYQTWAESGRWTKDAKIIAAMQPELVSTTIAAGVPIPR